MRSSISEMAFQRNQHLNSVRFHCDRAARLLYRDLTKKSTITHVKNTKSIEKAIEVYIKYGKDPIPEAADAAIAVYIRMLGGLPTFFSLCERYAKVFEPGSALSDWLVDIVDRLHALDYDTKLPKDMKQRYVAAKLARNKV